MTAQHGPGAVSRDVSPPSFLRLAGHPLRWRLLRELARSDRQVRELCALIGQPQSLVSYHLGRLRAEQVVSTRRSSADRRDAYYSLELARCGALLTATGGALHPGLRLTPAPSGKHPRRSGRARWRVLFLCTGNSARSQMAQALVEHLTDGAVEASSAGSNPKPLHPNAVRAMREQGIDIAGRRSKHLSQFTDRRFDYVISLCDRVREVCPEFPDQPDLIHWSIPDPAREGDTDERTYPAFQRTATELAHPHRLPPQAHRSQLLDPGGELNMPDDLVSVRYIVDDVDAAIDFYTEHFGFTVLTSAPPAFADVVRGQLRLLLSGPASSAGRPMPDGRRPEPGGWNRIHLIVEDIATDVEHLRAAGLTFRNEIVSGPGGQQILIDDPSGNPIELFQPAGA
jgi:ArsR family transcriptional regulator, arsenate/arsenite/antimonite-responsive transcriptional repressor / arsenate reductase (thioredoxin)